MNKPLLGSLVAATLLLGNANAATMFERFEAMELEMKRLQTELAELKAEKADAKEEAPTSRDEDEDEDADESDEDEEKGNYDEDDVEDEDEESIDDLVAELQEEVMELTKATSGNHLKMSVDFRSSMDNVKYKMASNNIIQYTPTNRGTMAPVIDPTTGKPVSRFVEENQNNNAILSNRLWLNMNWQANENISFTGQLAYNKTYGARFGDTGHGAGFEDFDWVVNENQNGDGDLRVKSAYFLYRNDEFAGIDMPWTFSIGRRPSTNGHLISMRDDDAPASPSGHTINVEFDGISSKFSLENLTGVEGMYVKLCFGQGATNANEKFAASPFSNNEDDDLKDVWLAGLIFVPYDDGQYSIGTQFYGATNLIGSNVFEGRTTTPNPYQFGETTGLRVVGDIYSGAIYAKVDGIGDEWSDFLDDTTFFLSGAMSRTNPDDGHDQFGQEKAMLGSTDMQNGYSYWAGLQMPSLISEDGRMGFEFNHGSKYWRALTYGEDTMIGSKVAARGNAYEAYFTEPLIDDILSLQVRYTFIDYDYSGSNGFFGSASGAPLSIGEASDFGQGGNVADTSQDIRVYLRYRY